LGKNNITKLPEGHFDPKQRELFDTLEQAIFPFYSECTLIEILGALKCVELEAIQLYATMAE